MNGNDDIVVMRKTSRMAVQPIGAERAQRERTIRRSLDSVDFAPFYQQR